MDLASILPAIEKVSPLALLIVVCGWSLHRVFTFIESRYESKEAEKEAMRQVAHEKATREIHTSLVAHTTTEDERSNRMIELLAQMEAHLVIMATKGSGTMSRRTQRQVINYQFKWCRDEMLRHALQSIRRNNVKAAEDAVVTKVLSGWRSAVKDARQSIENLEGITVSYGDLFDRTLPEAFDTIWEWMVPIYGMHGSLLDANLESLTLKVKQLFDELWSTYVTLQVDTDADTESAVAKKHPDQTGATTGLLRKMADKLKTHVASKEVSA